MKKIILALIAACAGCCALLALIPLLAGGAVTGLTAWIGRFNLEAILCILPLGLAVTLGVFYWVRHFMGKKACASDGSCGCK